MERNPDWRLLVAFEAVARLDSFSRAATELNVLQPAVSRRVAQLETDLGVTLINRTRPNATLTSDGQVLFGVVSAGMSQVRNAVRQVARRPIDGPVVINTTIGFASCFLLRRLNQFYDRYPGVAIELVSRDLNDTYREEISDIITVFDSPTRLPGVEQHSIFHEEMIAVCSPRYLDQHPVLDGDLTGHRLLHLTAGIHGSDWISFAEGSPTKVESPAPTERFTSFMVYLQAALNGDGIAIGWSHLLQDHLDSGQLVKVVDRAVTSERGYFCCLRHDKGRETTVPGSSLIG